MKPLRVLDPDKLTKGERGQLRREGFVIPHCLHRAVINHDDPSIAHYKCVRCRRFIIPRPDTAFVADASNL